MVFLSVGWCFGLLTLTKHNDVITVMLQCEVMFAKYTVVLNNIII